MNRDYLERALDGHLRRELAPAVVSVTVGHECYYTPVGAAVAVTVRLDDEAAAWVPARAHELVLGLCWIQGALPSIVIVRD